MLKSIFRFLGFKKNSYNKIDQLRYLSQSALIEETAAPYMVRTTLFFISTVIISLIAWAGFTDVEEIAITQGEVIPSKHVQSIQHLEGGIVANINVVEGELVDEGQVIFVLDGTAAKQDLSAIQAKKLALTYQTLRLRSFINNTKPNFQELSAKEVNQRLIDEQNHAFESMIEARNNEKDVITEQIIQKESALNGFIERKATLKESMALVKEEMDLKNKLNKKGHLSKFKLLQIQKQFNDIKGEFQETESDATQAKNAIAEYKNRLESLEANFIDDAYQELNTVEGNINQIEETIKKLQEQVNRLEIRSPSYGFVKVLNIKTLGGVVESGQILAEIVPLEGNLIIETQIQPKDIGYIKTGQAVNVKVSSYDFSRYGTIEGILEYISATTFVNDDGTRYYMGRVSIEKNYVGANERKNLIVPGMTVQADIVTGAKSILAYLLKPIHTSVTTAFSER
jgi:HlyD family secretion protein/adhesin transport system membrane fusion protein